LYRMLWLIHSEGATWRGRGIPRGHLVVSGGWVPSLQSHSRLAAPLIAFISNHVYHRFHPTGLCVSLMLSVSLSSPLMATKDLPQIFESTSISAADPNSLEPNSVHPTPAAPYYRYLLHKFAGGLGGIITRLLGGSEGTT